MALDLNDKTANGNNLTNVNTVAASGDLPFGGDPASINTDSALFTAASSMHLDTGASPTNLNLGSSFTIEAWVNVTSISTSPFMTILSKWQGAGVRSYLLEVNRNTGGKFSFLASYDGTNVGAGPTDNDTAITINTWNHIAITYDNTTYRWYLNGVADGTTVATNGSLFASTALLSIGSGDSQFIDGKVDDVRIWDTTRTAPQIAASYLQQLAGSETNLQGYWPLNALGISGAVDQRAFFM